MSKTILLVEDALDLASVIRRELETEDFCVIHAADGIHALQLFNQGAPHLIVLDWMLPGMDGLTVLREIRKRSLVPVLMLTARGDEMDRVIGLEVGADDYLVKPFHMRELIARIRALLRRLENVERLLAQDQQPQPSSQPLFYGALRLDAEAYQASVEGELVNLTRTEFDLLHLMLRNPGRAFSRAYLLDTVWGENYITGDRSVDNAILRLRRKLGEVGDAIETVWGVGYRLVPHD